MKKLFIVLAILLVVGVSYATQFEDQPELESNRILRSKRRYTSPVAIDEADAPVPTVLPPRRRAIRIVHPKYLGGIGNKKLIIRRIRNRVAPNGGYLWAGRRLRGGRYRSVRFVPTGRQLFINLGKNQRNRVPNGKQTVIHTRIAGKRVTLIIYGAKHRIIKKFANRIILQRVGKKHSRGGKKRVIILLDRVKYLRFRKNHRFSQRIFLYKAPAGEIRYIRGGHEVVNVNLNTKKKNGTVVRKIVNKPIVHINLNVKDLNGKPVKVNSTVIHHKVNGTEYKIQLNGAPVKIVSQDNKKIVIKPIGKDELITIDLNNATSGNKKTSDVKDSTDKNSIIKLEFPTGPSHLDDKGIKNISIVSPINHLASSLDKNTTSHPVHHNNSNNSTNQDANKTHQCQVPKKVVETVWVGRNHTKRNHTKRNHTKRNHTKRNHTKINHTKINHIKRNHTKRNHTRKFNKKPYRGLDNRKPRRFNRKYTPKIVQKKYTNKNATVRNTTRKFNRRLVKLGRRALRVAGGRRHRRFIVRLRRRHYRRHHRRHHRTIVHIPKGDVLSINIGRNASAVAGFYTPKSVVKTMYRGKPLRIEIFGAKNFIQRANKKFIVVRKIGRRGRGKQIIIHLRRTPVRFSRKGLHIYLFKRPTAQIIKKHRRGDLIYINMNATNKAGQRKFVSVRYPVPVRNIRIHLAAKSANKTRIHSKPYVVKHTVGKNHYKIKFTGVPTQVISKNDTTIVLRPNGTNETLTVFLNPVEFISALRPTIRRLNGTQGSVIGLYFQISGLRLPGTHKPHRPHRPYRPYRPYRPVKPHRPYRPVKPHGPYRPVKPVVNNTNVTVGVKPVPVHFVNKTNSTNAIKPINFGPSATLFDTSKPIKPVNSTKHVKVIPQVKGNQTEQIVTLPGDINLNINLRRDKKLTSYNATVVLEMPNVEGQRLLLKLVGLGKYYNSENLKAEIKSSENADTLNVKLLGHDNVPTYTRTVEVQRKNGRKLIINIEGLTEKYNQSNVLVQ